MSCRRAGHRHYLIAVLLGLTLGGAISAADMPTPLSLPDSSSTLSALSAIPDTLPENEWQARATALAAAEKSRPVVRLLDYRDDDTQIAFRFRAEPRAGQIATSIILAVPSGEFTTSTISDYHVAQPSGEPSEQSPEPTAAFESLGYIRNVRIARVTFPAVASTPSCPLTQSGVIRLYFKPTQQGTEPFPG
ncbi:MAG: hypothetical protein K1X53_08635, partial [Candidatus Sumerlaeaceae bacterium]|nr:hypothetical protein [Candidatus Sumerlaeaceae bacterium]